MATAVDSQDIAGSRAWTVALGSVASFMVGLDVLIMMTAVSTLHLEFGTDAAGIGWSINAYEIGFAALILTGSVIGDRYGRKRMFIVGVAWFTVGSVLCALSTSMEMLVLARGFQGLGGGIATALALAVITASTPSERRGTAFGIWGAVMGMAVAVGPLVGGTIIHFLSWEWCFWLNVPIGIAVIVLAWRKIPETRGSATGIDFLGMFLSTAGVVSLSQALLRGGEVGWSAPSIVGGIIAGLLLLIAFVAWQRRTSAPMMPLKMFENLSFSGGCGVGFVLGAGLYGNAFLFAQYLQLALGNDPLMVGIKMLPWVALAPVVAPIAGMLADRIGERPIVIVAIVLFAGAFFAIGPLVKSGAGYGTLVLPLIVAGVGVAALFPALATAVMRVVDPDHLGVASGVSNTIRQVGAVFGVAVAVAIFTSFGGYQSPQDFVDGYTPAAVVLAAITLAGLIPALLIRPRSVKVDTVSMK
ncbi:DHA2 family efflux MFS transporter permease subunit [Nocardia sp. CS682]|uniref:DHA2 family efflux MFS transporter permease subunit n=1 Tax=Nocardia sp. CS682 TaxID=1047172 RepID=UPI0010752609|nr:DHA2 family efflux MFS transporter permease subunit [Nocardia sp. CS682]